MEKESSFLRFSPAIEDYIKTINQLEQEHVQVGTCLLAERLGFTPASVNGPLTIAVGDLHHALDRSLAQAILVCTTLPGDNR